MLPFAGAVLILQTLVVNAAVYGGLNELPKDLEAFDYIIAGGGTAGSVLASRLSENRRVRVLLVEAGSDTAGVLELEIPAWAPRRNETEFNWRYKSEPMSGLGGRVVEIPRGKGLGGSSAINGLVYTRGSSDDYDNWARVTGDNRWRWRALRPYILRHEQWTEPAGGRDPTGEYEPRFHGTKGNVHTSLSWNAHNEHDIRVVRNSAFPGSEFPFAKDVNSGSPLGASWRQSTIGNGERYSAAKSYLGPRVRVRDNLTILLNTYAVRVLPATSSHLELPQSSDLRVPDIRVVEMISRHGGVTKNFTAGREVILTGGVFGSPQILLNSGIGDPTDLNALGIPLVLDSPDVGKSISEHVAIYVSWETVPVNTTVIDNESAFAMWQQNRTGPLTERFPAHQNLNLRLPSNATIFSEYDDPSTGSRSPHIVYSLTPYANGSMALLTPYSRGTVKLRSRDPFDPPYIDYNLLSHPFDIAALKEGIRSLKRFYSGPAWEGFITAFNGPDPDTLSTEAFDLAVRSSAFTIFHPVGSAQMSNRHEKRGVVDGEMMVKGARNLRVVDASVFPKVPSANTQAPVYILAERAADMIKEAQ